MWIVVVIAAVAVILIVALGRIADESAASEVTAVDDAGLRVGDLPAIEWASIFEVSVITRRELGGTWFGFEVLSETAGMVSVGGDVGLGEAFLSQSHHLPGFDHVTLADTLGQRRGRAVCFRR